MNLTEERKYTKTHEWVCYDGEFAYVGITEYAAGELGDLVFVDLPEEGAEVEAGESFCEVESVKAVSEVNSPVSGTIAEVNTKLEDAPESLNEAPYENWIVKVRDVTGCDELLTEAEYEAFLEEEA